MSLFTALFRKKFVNPDARSDLLPCLTATDLVLLGIGAIIGTGIFVLTGHAAAGQAGPAVVLSFVVSGLACAFAALAYAELSASVGGCGSAYGYSYAAFGELIAWIIGWDLILEYGVSVAAVANGWSGYFVTGLKAMGFAIPDALTRGPLAPVDARVLADPTLAILPENSCDVGGVIDLFGHKFNACYHLTGAIMNLPAAAIILALMFMLIRGVKGSARLNSAMVMVKLMAIVIFVAVAATKVDPSLWHPFTPFGWFSTTPEGKTIGVLAGASVVFFAYVGFDAVSTSVEETKNPKRDVPIGILGALFFCTLIYILVSGLLTGVVSYTELNVSSPVAFALERLGIHWAAALVATGVIAGLTTVMLVLYYALTRVIFAMSRDGLLPGLFSRVSAGTHVPVNTTIVCGLIMAAAAGVVPLGALAELVNIGTLAAFVVVCAGVIVLRLRHPEMPRPFKTPGGLLVPVLGVLSCGALIAFLPRATHIRFGLWLAVGMVIYAAYSFRKSKLSAHA